MNAPNVYDALLAAGCQMDSHASDLYVQDTPAAREIIREHGHRCTTFTNNINGERWLEVPFAYAPWWRERSKV